MKLRAAALPVALPLALLLLAGCAGTSSGGGAPVAHGATTGGAGGAATTGGGGATTSGATTGGATTGGAFITPDDPGPADVQLALDSSRTRPISRYIYGMNGRPGAGGPQGVTLDRQGGNRWTAYNWENNASNAGTDWLNQNDGFLGASGTPGEAVRLGVTAAHAASAGMIVTVPICGHVAADKNGGGDVNQTPSWLQTRFHPTHAAKGAPLSLAPDTGDGAVYQDEFVHWVKDRFPYAWTELARPIFFGMDNEPDLWSSTHPRIHASAVTYDELRQKTIAAAAAVKAVVPQAAVFAPGNYGWLGLVDLQSAPDAGGRDFVEYFLGAMRAAEGQHGRRLVDAYDLHWYPEATGAGVRVIEDDASPAVAAARVQAPRSLWDPTYVETSWITQWSTAGAAIRLLPRIQEKIDAHYPGTKIAVTEYYYGGGDHISGGVAEADALGVFGREGVFAAALWRIGASAQSFIYAGFSMFRNYDGRLGAFGDTSVEATTSDAVASSVYASIDAGSADRMVLVAINKTGGVATAGIQVRHTVRFARAEIYQLTSAQAAPVRAGDIAIAKVNAFTYAMPPMSVTTIVLRP